MCEVNSGKPYITDTQFGAVPNDAVGLATSSGWLGWTGLPSLKLRYTSMIRASWRFIMDEN